MHDVLEGCLSLEIRCLLTTLIKEDLLNERLRHFPFGPDASDHPPKELPASCLSMGNASLKLGGNKCHIIL